MLIKVVQKIFIGILSLILFSIIAGFLFLGFNKAKNIYIFNEVKNFAQSEFYKIKLENEILEEREEKIWGNSCSYDYKVGAIRCNTNFYMYFKTKNPMVEEFQKVDNYLVNLGWERINGKAREKKEVENTVSKGLAPYEIYIKKGKYKLDLQIHFYREVSQECEYICSDKVKAILEKYQKDYPTIYSISLYTDMVDR